MVVTHEVNRENEQTQSALAFTVEGFGDGGLQFAIVGRQQCHVFLNGQLRNKSSC